MLFNSYIFIFVFLPAALVGYFLLNRFKKYTAANWFLIGMSLWFYGYFNYSYLPIICVSILVNFTLSKLIQKECIGRIGRKLFYLLGLLLNIGSIFYFKYYDFFVDNINTIFKTSWTLKNLILPLGISFFTFQQISYIVDSHRGETKNYRFTDYALYVSFFPQLIAGPIVLHKELMPQIGDLSKRRFSSTNATEGLYVFSIGLFKKVMLADTFSKAVTAGFAGFAAMTSAEAWIVMLCYTFQIYFDFSGYSDMAIGLGKMFNFELPQNFNSPYLCTSIDGFWERWHLTLTRFLRTYIYIPLGGSRKGLVRTYVNIMIVFIVSGIWHGANWTFILWGTMHGVINCINRATRKQWEKLNVTFRWMFNFALIIVLMVPFRAESVGQAIGYLQKMFSMDGALVNPNIAIGFVTPQMYLIKSLPIIKQIASGVANFDMWFTVFLSFFLILNVKNCGQQQYKPDFKRAFLTVFCLAVSLLSFSGVTEFLYFNF